MGCACNRNKIKVTCYSASIELAKHNQMQLMGRFQKKNNFFNNNGIYFNKISQNCTFIIFNFLNFKELYECGKCCSSFKILSSQPYILRLFSKKDNRFSEFYQNNFYRSSCRMRQNEKFIDNQSP